MAKLAAGGERADGRAPDAERGEGPQRLVLSKHEAAGNDFLVLVDGDGSRAAALTPGRVRVLCDRRRGVGADGLIVVSPLGKDGDLAMVLFNADGSQAEMSGNGIRCLAQAAVAAGLVRAGTFRVSTAAGTRAVEYPDGDAGSRAGTASVEMGPVRLGPEVDSPVPGARARLADVGNPHVVVIGGPDLDVDDIDLATVSARISQLEQCSGGVNVEIVRAGPAPGTLDLRVFERGVGETLACGTGSCAAAAVAHDYGLVGERVLVVNPGGALGIRLPGEDGDPVVLTGPVRHVAEVTVEPAALDGAALDGAALDGAALDPAAFGPAALEPADAGAPATAGPSAGGGR